MKRAPFLFFLVAPCVAVLAADLKPDATTEIPASAQRPIVVTLPATAVRSPLHPPVQADLPAGFELVTVAESPLVTHPIMGCLDDRGRLFVGDATGVNWNNKQLDANPPNRILMLEDTDGDGIYDKSTVFADKMTFPQGGCWLNGSLYVCSPPGLWKLTDTDGDGVADKRELIVSGFDYSGNAADVHGPWLHPNGRLYWCHGRKGHKVVGKEGTVIHEGLASGIWSCRPDGSDVRWHSLGCGDNPVKIDFTPEGDIIGVQNLYYSQPRGDTIVHWLQGGVYERSDQLKAIQGLPRTIEHMPVMYNFGHVAVSGCCFAKTGALFPNTPLQLFVTHFNTQRVVRMELTPEGASYSARENEFLKLHDPDIHLTDVLEAADGSLIVLNTGGWFRIGCPSSLMAKPDVMGAIYRIRKASGNRALVASGKNATVPTANAKPVDLVKLLASTDPHVRLRACDALADAGSAGQEGFDALHAMFKEPLDLALEHAAIRAYAMQKIKQQASGEGKEISGTPEELDRHAKRMILQVAYAAGTPDGAEPVLELKRMENYLHAAANDGDAAAHPQTLAACAFVMRRVKETPAVLQDLFIGWMAKPSLNAAQMEAIEVAVDGRLDAPAAQQIITALLSHPNESVGFRAVQILATQNLNGASEAWAPPLEKMLSGNVTPPLLDAIKKLKSPRFDERLKTIADDAKRPLAIRLKALDSMQGLKFTADTFAMVKGVLTNGTSSAAAQIQAAAMLARAPLDKAQKLAVAPLLASAGPVELKELISTVRKSKDTEIASAFATELAKNQAIASQQESFYRTIFSDQAPDIFDKIVMPAIRRAVSDADGRMSKLPALAVDAATKGRPDEGRKIYESGKGTCIACHQIGDKGRAIGPNLSKIGAIRTERDIVESIMFPSNTIARDYEAHIIETTGGETIVGVIKSHTAEGLLVADVAGQEKNVPAITIASDTTLPTSLMPMGLDRTLGEQEFLDLVAYLRSLK
jgi:putative membrane-bound dehydrogenase-like protein